MGERAEKCDRGNVTQEGERDAEDRKKTGDGREIECDRKGERRRVQLVAETERDVRV